MERIILTRDQIQLFEQGNKIQISEKEEYINYPFWIRVISGTKEPGEFLCEVYHRTELPIKKGYQKGGLQASKYIISKSDGSAVDPNAWYFVLRVDEDPHARNAALEYSRSIIKENRQLAIELIDAVIVYEGNKNMAELYWHCITDNIFEPSDTMVPEHNVCTWKEFKEKYKI